MTAERRSPRLSARCVLALVGASALIAGCGGSSGASGTGTSGHASTAKRQGNGSSTAATTSTTAARPKPAYPPYPTVLRAAQATGPTSFTPAVRWHGRTAAWVARAADGVALLSFDQRLVTLRLHSGTLDAGSTGWRWGPSVQGRERRVLLGAFNGGFRLNIGAGGFASNGRVAVTLRPGLGSIVTYTDGTTNIGSWHAEVPAPGRRIASVRQNLSLLIDHGVIASSTACVSCWGATLGGVSDPARSALGITSDGRLVWAGGEHLTPAQLAQALRQARVVRAVELDINPEWVAAYLYGHRGGHGPLAPIPIVAGQPGIPGQYLTPWSRDFFSVEAR